MFWKVRDHPNAEDVEIVEFDTKVHHEIEVPKGLSKKEIKRIIKKYLKGERHKISDIEEIVVPGYEDKYPETASEIVTNEIDKDDEDESIEI